MEVIKFLKSENHIEVDLHCSPTIVKITFFNIDDIYSDEVLTSGFEVLNEYSFENQSADYYYGYNTIYAKTENEVYLSNDGSVYVPKEESEQNSSTKEILTLEQVKINKIQSLSEECNRLIINGIDVESNGEMEHFSYTNEDQLNLKEIYDLAKETQSAMYYHSDGNSCRLYTIKEIAFIYAAQTVNKMHHITYFNQLKAYVQTIEVIEEVNMINYGDELTGEYLEIYTNVMEQVSANIQKILNIKNTI